MCDSCGCGDTNLVPVEVQQRILSDNERTATRRKTRHEPLFPDPQLRWTYWTQLPAAQALAHVKEKRSALVSLPVRLLSL